MSVVLQPENADLFVTTALKPSAALIARASDFAAELGVSLVARRNDGLNILFRRMPDSNRVLVVQDERLLLADRNGTTLFYHPNMAYLRLATLLRGGRDLLIDACQLRPGDSVLDATLGYASEAILCAHVVGADGEVHGVEASPPLGIVVREGLKTVLTHHDTMNATMRRVTVIHLGDHLDFLRACPDNRYDVVCFDPFFDEILPDSENLDSLRAFGSHAPLLPQALVEARRVARRRVVVKAVRWSDTLEQLGITQGIASRSGKVAYGILPADG